MSICFYRNLIHLVCKLIEFEYGNVHKFFEHVERENTAAKKDILDVIVILKVTILTFY